MYSKTLRSRPSVISNLLSTYQRFPDDKDMITFICMGNYSLDYQYDLFDVIILTPHIITLIETRKSDIIPDISKLLKFHQKSFSEEIVIGWGVVGTKNIVDSFDPFDMHKAISFFQLFNQFVVKFWWISRF